MDAFSWVNSVNERDLNLLNTFTCNLGYMGNFLEGLCVPNSMKLEAITGL